MCTSKILTAGFFTLLLFGCTPPRPDIYVPEQAPPPLVLKKRPNVALVLGGGGARGFAHIGVIKVLRKAGVPINLVVGTSAGSIVGALYSDSADINKAGNILLHAKRDQVMDLSLFDSLSGPVSGYALQNFLIKNMHAKNFKQLKIPFIAVTSDLRSGTVFPISSGPIAPAVNASSAVPLIFHPVKLYGHVLVDGGVTDNVAVNIAKEYNPKIIIAINISQAMSPQIPDTALGIFMRGYTISFYQLGRLRAQGATIILHPQVGHVGVFDGSQRMKLMKEGQAVARLALPYILQVLAKKHIRLTRQHGLLHMNA